jgi:hypothetical protein
MLFFRSEADLEAWLHAENSTRGATLTVSQLWRLSQRWYHNRLDVDYRGRTKSEVQEIFREVGLDAEFWQ